MSDTVIQVEGLSKKYRIQHQSEKQRYDTLRDELTNRFKSLFTKKSEHTKQSTSEDFWALRDVSFEIKQGEVVGIIGRNGAGKSTLLKILSRITEPTQGRVRLKGRVASLLEVGTGFHPELTGRENIYLNGAILGMSRVEIKRKFDEIVAFAEVEKFLDTPVKRYSSGMYVRLAFAVAAHLEPEILIVDEVLAVGDAQFQAKCMGKMDDVAKKEGRTILFVSHNMGAIKQLTSRCIFLNLGKIRDMGPTKTVLDTYARASNSFHEFGTGRYATILEARLVDEHGFQVPAHTGERILWVELVVESTGNPISSLECFLTDLEGTRLGIFSPGHFADWHLPPVPGRYRCRLPLSMPALASGDYGIDVLTTGDGNGPDHFVPNAIVFSSSSLLNFPSKWELKKQYAVGYFVLDAGNPVVEKIN